MLPQTLRSGATRKIFALPHVSQLSGYKDQASEGPNVADLAIAVDSSHRVISRLSPVEG
jgi:hypothetical protein